MTTIWVVDAKVRATILLKKFTVLVAQTCLSVRTGRNVWAAARSIAMPIQFRCGTCQQLLGIARRKAGSIVPCPTCSAKTLVPNGTSEPPPVLPARKREKSNQPVSIFDRVDVDKLLEKPTRPDVVEDSSVAVAPPPVRRKIVFNPVVHEEPVQPTLPDPVEEPKALTKLEEVDVEPVNDEPFALPDIPVLTPARTSSSKVRLALLGGLAILLAGAAFLAGHWLGAHHPLF